MPKIYVDGQELSVKEGENILEACLSAGINLPYFCWHPAMGSIGSCRQCAIVQYQNEEDTDGRIVMGCMTPVTEGARFSLNANKGVELREAVVESLMLNHPHDCPVCGEGGECHLQDMTVMVGHRDRRYTGLKNTHRNQYLGPLISHEMNRCITCYRCVRYYDDYAGGTDLSAQASHDHVYFGRHEDGVLESEFSGNLVEVCPTGVFTDKPLLKQYTRKWDLQSAPSICNGCAVGCNISPGERYGKLKRVHNRFNDDVNGYFLCDRGRFGSGYVNSSLRLDYAGLRKKNGSFQAIHQQAAVDKVARWAKGKKIAAIGSPRASLEANYLLREWAGKDNFSAGFSEHEGQVIHTISTMLSRTNALSPSIKQMEAADVVLILGEDVTNTAPRVALGLRQAIRNKAYQLAEQAGLPKWQDAAVRNLAQDQRSPMIIVSPIGTRLDDVASQLITLGIEDITQFAAAVADVVSGKHIKDVDVNAVAQLLKDAERPLIISGSSLLSDSLVKSAAVIASRLAVDNKQTMLSYCIPESNSLGVALLAEDTKSIEELIIRADKFDVLLLLENDLHRRISPDQIDQLKNSGVKLVGLDVLENETLSACDLVLPVTSYAESEGTLINSEGRAQRHYPVFEPAAERMPSWKWILELATACEHTKIVKLTHFDEIVESCADSCSLFGQLTQVAPDHKFRSHGLKISRKTHRYSGRTAISANQSVHEPLQPVDQETPLTFSMEGINLEQAASLTPFYWSPGWNSNQSLQKFQAEVDGPLSGNSSGQRLIEPKLDLDPNCLLSAPSLSKTSISDRLKIKPDESQLVPIYRVHGSDELSSYTDEIAELAGEAFVAISAAVAEQLNVVEGDGLIVSNADGDLSLEVKILNRVASDCVGYSAGYTKTNSLRAGNLVVLSRDSKWQRRMPQLIATDSGNKRPPNNIEGSAHV
jgi:NADH-quinone oxidoreductase subunit G